MNDTVDPFAKLRNPLAERLAGGGLGLAMIVKQFESIEIALAAKSCGYDAIYVDLEHSVISERAASQISITAIQLGVTPLVRVPSHEPHYANRLLDNGALGVVAPHVETAAEARAIVRACKFAPFGTRSPSGAWPHLAYSAVPAAAVREGLNRLTTVIVMLESPEAIGNAHEIAAVEGVDILHVGCNDLCDAMGIPGQFGDPRIEAHFRTVVEACKRHGKVSGIGGLSGDPQLMQKLIQIGARFVTAGNEWAFMMGAARERAATLREMRCE